MNKKENCVTIKAKIIRIFVKIMISEHFAEIIFFVKTLSNLHIFCENRKEHFCFKPTLVHKEDLLHLLECWPAEFVLGLWAGAGRHFVSVTRRWADFFRLWQLNTTTTFEFKR
jgi:hypothetical protein